MATLDTRDPTAVAVVTAVHTGRVEDLARLLHDHPGLAAARLGDEPPGGMSRTLLHVATDWPGHFPRVAETIAVLVTAGAEVEARFVGPHRETPLHWAASSDDVEAIAALLAAGADIDADGAVIGGGTPLADATAFAQWRAARVLVDRGARARVVDLAALGETDAVLAALDAAEGEVDVAFWSACHGGRLGTAKALLQRGAVIDWLPGWEDATPLDVAARAGAHDVVRWLHTHGARTADQVRERD